jgi:hypothetical protein
MRFKKFLLEFPIFTRPETFPCPYKGHGDEFINGKDPKHQYDVMAEGLPKIENYQQKMAFAFRTKDPHGIAPFICSRDNKMFMLDVDNNIAYAPVSKEDIEFCKAYLLVAKSDRFRDRNSTIFDIDKISILTPMESKK